MKERANDLDRGLINCRVSSKCRFLEGEGRKGRLLGTRDFELRHKGEEDRPLRRGR